MLDQRQEKHCLNRRDIMKFSKLLSAKWLISIAMTLVFCYLALAGKITSEQFMAAYMMVVGVYFGQSVAKKNTPSD